MPIFNTTYFKAVDEITALGGWHGTVFDADSGFHRNYTRRWRIQTKQQAVGPAMMGAAAPALGLPVPYAPYVVDGAIGESDSRALAVKIFFERDPEAGDSWDQWIGTAEYSTKIPEGGPSGWITIDGDPANTPWLRKPRREWEVELVNVAAKVDLDDKPYWNSANMFFKPAPTIPRHRAIMVVERNEYNVDDTLIDRYTNCLNAQTFLNRPAETVQLFGLRATEEWLGDIRYWRVIYRIRFARKKGDGSYESLQPEFLDAGTHKLAANPLAPFASMPVPIFRNGHPVIDPLPLDGNGQELRPTINPTTGAATWVPVFKKFREYLKEDISKILTSGLSAPPP